MATERTVGVGPRGGTRTPAYTKKVCKVHWKAAMGESVLGKAAWRWARTCAARGRRLGSAGGGGGGQRPGRVVRMWPWPRSKRFQRRCQVRSLREQVEAWLAAAMPATTARWRKCQRVLAERLRRRILSASQALTVRPQPGRAWRLLQKIRRAR